MTPSRRASSGSALKVALVSTSYPPRILGGAERSVRELAQGLAAAGDDVTVVCLAPPEEGRLREERDGAVRVLRIGTPAFLPFTTGGKSTTAAGKVRWHLGELVRWREASALRRILRRTAPDVVHLNNPAGFGWLGRLACTDRPVVHTLRDYYLRCTNATAWHGDHECGPRDLICRVTKAVFRLPLTQPAVVVGVSSDILERHARHGLVPTGVEAAVVHNLPDVGDAAARAQRLPRRFGVLGRIGADKGTWLALEAFARLKERVPDAELLLAGTGIPADLEELERRLAGVPGASYVGEVVPADFYGDVDVALVPTQWHEPFGRTAAEALACGTPVLASEVGGLPEVARLYGGRAGLVARYRSPEAWAERMLAVATAGVDVLPVRAAAPQRSPEDQYRELYRRAVALRRQARRGTVRARRTADSLSA